jgi:hypothetical protein
LRIDWFTASRNRQHREDFLAKKYFLKFVTLTPSTGNIEICRDCLSWNVILFGNSEIGQTGMLCIWSKLTMSLAFLDQFSGIVTMSSSSSSSLGTLVSSSSSSPDGFPCSNRTKIDHLFGAGGQGPIKFGLTSSRTSFFQWAPQKKKKKKFHFNQLKWDGARLHTRGDRPIMGQSCTYRTD